MNVEWWFYPIAYMAIGTSAMVGSVLNTDTWRMFNDTRLGPSKWFWIALTVLCWPIVLADTIMWLLEGRPDA